MDSIADLFFKRASENPEKIAIHCDGYAVSYQKLADMVNTYTAFFLRHGVDYRAHVGITMQNSIESVALILCAANMGVGLVPVNPTLPIDAMLSAFNVCDVKCVIGKRVFLEEFCKNKKSTEFSLFSLDEGFSNIPALPAIDECVNGERNNNHNVTGGETLILTMTSGSTGEPKPIDLTQNNKLIRARMAIDLYNLSSDDVILAATPLYHSLAERLVIIPLIIGATSVLMPRFTPDLWLSHVSEHKVTFTIAVSTQLVRIAELISSPFYQEIETLRCVVSSSALLDHGIKKDLIKKLKCDFHEMYGTSEVATATDIDFNAAASKQKSVGKCLVGVDVRIVNPEGEILPNGQIGEILCKSISIFNGYYNLPQKTADSMTGEYFKTGDLGYMDEDSFLYYSGRIKELIITGGINVYPQDLESELIKLPQIKECAVFAMPDLQLVEVVAVAIVLEKDAQLTQRHVHGFCAKNLADYQQPHHIFFVSALPKNEMGKVKKHMLSEYVRLPQANQ